MRAAKKAEFWRREGDQVRCELCPHGCLLGEGDVGRCHARSCQDGVLLALGYGQLSAVHLDPIEKKPLYHYFPGSQILSVGGWGCNLSCAFCQNWQLSTTAPPAADGRFVAPGGLAQMALRAHSPMVAHTYNEPLINLEYVRDTARACAEVGVGTVLVTNGYVCPRPLELLLPLVQAANVDLKSLDDAFYRRLCGGTLAPVLKMITRLYEAGVHVELTCLLIPGENSSSSRVDALAAWVAGELGSRVPLHLSAYFPCHRMAAPPTDDATLLKAYEAATKHLDYVYLGNTVLPKGQSTRCPGCGAVLVSRSGYRTCIEGVEQGACACCSRSVDLVLA